MKKTLKLKIDGVYYSLKVPEKEVEFTQKLVKELNEEIAALKKKLKLASPNQIYIMLLINYLKELDDLKKEIEAIKTEFEKLRELEKAMKKIMKKA